MAYNSLQQCNTIQNTIQSIVDIFQNSGSLNRHGSWISDNPPHRGSQKFPGFPHKIEICRPKFIRTPNLELLFKIKYI